VSLDLVQRKAMDIPQGMRETLNGLVIDGLSV
jgi:hypothetical protein